jgi:hypothetical protein
MFSVHHQFLSWSKAMPQLRLLVASFHCSSPGSVPGQVMWDLWGTMQLPFLKFRIKIICFHKKRNVLR